MAPAWAKLLCVEEIAGPPLQGVIQVHDNDVPVGTQPGLQAGDLHLRRIYLG